MINGSSFCAKYNWLILRSCCTEHSVVANLHGRHGFHSFPRFTQKYCNTVQYSYLTNSAQLSLIEPQSFGTSLQQAWMLFHVLQGTLFFSRFIINYSTVQYRRTPVKSCRQPTVTLSLAAEALENLAGTVGFSLCVSPFATNYTTIYF
jgi:hypothetical protein